MRAPAVLSLVFLVFVVALPACSKKTAEPEAAPPTPKQAVERDAIRRGPIKGTIGKPLIDASMKDMQAAIKATGWVAAGYTESTSGGTTTRTFPVTRGRITGAVSWYRTNTKDLVHATVVQGWPSAEDGECILSVKLSDEGRHDDARRLLAALVGD